MQQKNYFIQCEKCDEQIVAADNPQKLLELLFQKLTRHNTDSMEEELCAGAKSDMSMDEMRGAFAGEQYHIYEATKHEKKPVEWEKAGYGGLKNE